ncbi:MAG: 2-hydroxyacid dehydrogenase [Candidatus Methanomethylicaceae archaeon]
MNKYISLKVLICIEKDSLAYEYLSKYKDNLFDLIAFNRNINLKNQVSDIDVLIPISQKVDEEVLINAHKLILIQQFGVGLETININAASKNGIYVAITPVNSVSVAELALMFMLMLSRKYKTTQECFKERKWFSPMGNELSGKTLLIIGLGNIGKALAKMAKGLDMYAIGIKRKIEKVEYVDEVYTNEKLQELLSRADHIVVSLPLTEETRNFISLEHFSIMKRTAYFINVSRRAIVDKNALEKALKEKWIAGAALDVFWEEPANPKEEIYNLPNVLTTPHIGGLTQEAYERTVKTIIENIRLVLQGKIPKYVVDREEIRKFSNK